MLDVRTKIHESTDFISRDPSQVSFVSTTSFEVLTKIFLAQRTHCVTDTQNICLTHKSWALSEKPLGEGWWFLSKMLADACSLGPGITGKVYSYHRWSVICCAHQHCPKKEKMNVSFYLQGVLPVCGYSPKMGHFTVDKALVFGCLVVRTRCFLCWGSGLIPGQGTKILQAARCGQKNKNKQTNKKNNKEKKKKKKREGVNTIVVRVFAGQE